eukprot:jgi/Psemu1/33382/gm1.33382_g
MRTPVVGHTYLSRGKKEKSEESEGSESDSSQDDNRVRNRYRNLTCYQCGQKGHIVTICKAIEHMDGMTIRTNNKNRNNTKEEEQQKGPMMLIDQSDSKSNGDETESNVEDYLDELDYNYQISWTNCMKGITKVDSPCTILSEGFPNQHLRGNRGVNLDTDAGMTIIPHVGDLPGFGSVWLYPEGIANALSFDGVAKTKGYMIEYNNLYGELLPCDRAIRRSKDILAMFVIEF